VPRNLAGGRRRIFHPVEHDVPPDTDMRLVAVPGETFSGRVNYIYPYAESKTRTIKVRIEFANPGLILKPDMYADVTIQASRQVDATVIPTEAVIRSGAREQVFVLRAPGKFEPREVKLGVTSDGLTQVIEGVRIGERVVTSAQFLIDSESRLREAAAKMMETQKAEKPQPDEPPAKQDTGTTGAEGAEKPVAATPSHAEKKHD